MVACHVDPVVSVYLGCRSNKVLLSYETVQKQLAHHPELPISHYQIVHSALRLGAFHRCNKRPQDSRRSVRRYPPVPHGFPAMRKGNRMRPRNLPRFADQN